MPHRVALRATVQQKDRWPAAATHPVDPDRPGTRITVEVDVEGLEILEHFSTVPPGS
jgi:hypothetical protein